MHTNKLNCFISQSDPHLNINVEWSIVKATDATIVRQLMPPQLMQNNSIELCNCSFHIQHQAN